MQQLRRINLLAMVPRRRGARAVGRLARRSPLRAALLASLAIHAVIVALLPDRLLPLPEPDGVDRDATLNVSLVPPGSPMPSPVALPPPLPDALTAPVPGPPTPPSLTEAPRPEPDIPDPVVAPDMPEIAAPAPVKGPVAEPVERADVVASGPVQDGAARTLAVAAVTLSEVKVPAAQMVLFARRAASAGERQALDERIRRLLRDDDEPAPRTVQWRHNGRTYRIRLERTGTTDATRFERAVAGIRTEAEGLVLATELEYRRVAFSRFAHLVDDWDSDVWFARDEIDGRFHANSDIHVLVRPDAMPLFRGLVTVSRLVKFEGDARRAEIFRGGIETRVARISLPWSVEIPGAQPNPRADIHAVDDGAEITFLAGGGYELSYPDTEPEQRTVAPGRMLYIVGGDRHGITVKGVVNGPVTVYSPRRIIVAGDLTYARDPDAAPDSRDLLGIVSDGLVEVAATAVTGQGDVRIHAAIYAGRRFLVKRARSGGQALLDIYGSLVARSMSATEPRFATRLRFDPRLESARPADFPMTDRFELAGWDGQWSVVSAASVSAAE